ncbi:MAG: conjugal transfer protein [Clostridiales bacterium]|uniref:conjugal transfer protein n=1 Tax=Flavonifractor porci TaxID=3133422 RepID=UPI00309578A8|nr:conjugal transfer protein [Clostridiales bacterium]
MKKRYKSDKPVCLFALYVIFVATYGCLCWAFPEYRRWMFPLWYQMTAVLWLALAVLAVRLMQRKKQIGKIKSRRT